MSTLTGQDWVGSAATAESLGLSQTYSLNLLTACSESDGSTTCGKPQIGFTFDPSSDLDLRSTSIQGFSSAYSDQIRAYGKVSTFLGAGYILGVIFIALSFILVAASRCFPSVTVFSQLTSGLAFVFLLASAIASIVKFHQLKDAFNNALGGSGIQTQTTSKMFGLAFTAAILVFLAFILTLLLPRDRRNERNRGGIFASGPDGKSGSNLLTRIATFRQRKYVAVEKQGPIAPSRSVSPGSDRARLRAEDDFSHEYPNDFAMGPIKKHGGQNANARATYDPPARTTNAPQISTAYDPYL